MNWRLEFDPTKLPRTLTRDQWKAVDRWRRTVERQVRLAMGKK